jgi:hypothetical protein
VTGGSRRAAAICPGMMAERPAYNKPMASGLAEFLIVVRRLRDNRKGALCLTKGLPAAP